MFVVLSLSVYTPGKHRSFLNCGGNLTRYLWFVSPMLYQQCYEDKSVRVGDIQDQNVDSRT
jgi:hypothetical protein